jgi:hypothetical protein
MSRYGDNIRRIAQVEILSESVREARQRLTILAKAAIPGQRAIAYPNITQKGSPGVTNPNQDGSPDPKDPTDKNPLDNHGRNDDQTDGDDLINGSKVLQPDEDPGALDLKDCETGEEIDVYMNTAANDGESKFKHPDGWGILGPQIDPSYTDGLVWKIISGATAYYSNNFNGMIALRSAVDSSTSYSIGPAPDNVISATPASFGAERIAFSSAGQSVGANLSGGTIYDLQEYVAATPIGTGKFGQQDCSVTSDSNSACDEDPPTVYNTWQEQDPDYEHQLVFSAQDGGFVSSTYDDGLPAKFRNNVGSGRGINNLRLCTNEGNEVVVSALRDGTFAFFEEDGFGFPKEDAKIFHFDSNGKYVDTIRPDEYDDLRSTNNPAA